MKKKFIFLFLLGMLLVETLSAQCYIQYTYTASGHRIKRACVGGCGRPASKDDMENIKSDPTEFGDLNKIYQL